MAHEGYHEPVEWIRRRNAVFDRELRDTLFKTGPITGQH
jgi:hypothetical protein